MMVNNCKKREMEINRYQKRNKLMILMMDNSSKRKRRSLLEMRLPLKRLQMKLIQLKRIHQMRTLTKMKLKRRLR